MSYQAQNPNGQAPSANSTPVVLSTEQEAKIDLLATKAKQDLLLAELELKADLTETQPVAQGVVDFFFSTVNSTVAQLASGATFTGTIEDITAYPALSLMAFADQDLTVTVRQFIDVAGTKLAEEIQYSLTANEKFAYSYPINGNYMQMLVKNEGGSTTTTLQLDTAYGIIDQTNEIKDDFLRGQATQTATVNNILTPTSGTASVDVSKYRAFVCQVVSTGTGGTFIFEGSNDNVNFQSIPVYNQALIVRVPIVTAITATSTQIMYEGSCNFKFIRLRIATTITGGSIRSFTSFLHNTLGATSQVVSNGTAANFLATVSGTVTANNNAGTAAHSAAVSGNPVYGAGKVLPTTAATVDTTLVAGDAAGLPMTTSQQLAYKPFGTAELDVTTNISSSVTVNTVQQILPSSGTASVRNYVAGLIVYSDQIAIAGNAWILDGQGAIGTSVTIATPGVFTSTAHDLKIGDAIVFTAIGTITGITTNTIYYITATSFAATTFTVATTLGGSAIQITGSTSAFTFYRVLHLIRLQTTALSYPIVIAFPTPLRGMANVATNLLIPVSLTTGNIYITTNGYRGF